MKIKSVFNIAGIIVVSIWILAIWLYFGSKNKDNQSVELEELGHNEIVKYNQDKPVLGEQWLNAFFKSSKVGYVKLTRAKTEGGYIFTQESELKFNIMGKKRDMYLTSSCLVSDSMTLKNFSFNLKAGPANIDVTGKVNKDILNISFKSAGNTESKKIPLKSKLFFDLNIKPYIVQKGIEPGKTVSFSMFDPQTMSNRKVFIKIHGWEEIVIDNKKHKALYMSQYFENMEEMVLESWVDENGISLREKTPIGLSFELVSKKEAKSPVSKVTEDMLVSMAVSVDKNIDNQKNLKNLSVKLIGIDLNKVKVPSDYRQVFTNGQLKISKEPFNKKELTDKTVFVDYSKNENINQFLKPETLVQSDDEKIISKSLQITNGVKGIHKKVLRILDWVYDSIEKTNVISIPSATEVLKTLKGDCNEHTVLFVALARAAGIPARTVVGIVYQSNLNKFFYHAWAEYYDERWITVDPSWDQIPADVTHISFAKGGLDKQLEILRYIGKLKIEVLSMD